jgi:hypothetical protein
MAILSRTGNERLRALEALLGSWMEWTGTVLLMAARVAARM